MRPIIAAAALLAALTGSAQAQADYPNRPITIIVNITPGSGTDALKAWDFGDGKTVKGTVVTGRVGNRFVGLTFLVPATQDASSINLSTIVSKALTKAKQA